MFFKLSTFILEFNFPKWKVKSVEIMPVWKLDKMLFIVPFFGGCPTLVSSHAKQLGGERVYFHLELSSHNSSPWEFRGTEIRNLEAGTESEVFGSLGRPPFIDLPPPPPCSATFLLRLRLATTHCELDPHQFAVKVPQIVSHRLLWLRKVPSMRFPFPRCQVDN